MSKALQDILQTTQLTQILDIGANPIDGDPPYKNMLDLGLCQVTGFEPQKQALDELLQKKGPNEGSHFEHLPVVRHDQLV
jgi:hypothetical protein